MEIKLEPFESSIRNQIGDMVKPEELGRIPEIIKYGVTSSAASDHVFSVGCSDAVGADAILEIVKQKTGDKI